MRVGEKYETSFDEKKPDQIEQQVKRKLDLKAVSVSCLSIGYSCHF